MGSLPWTVPTRKLTPAADAAAGMLIRSPSALRIGICHPEELVTRDLMHRDRRLVSVRSLASLRDDSSVDGTLVR